MILTGASRRAERDALRAIGAEVLDLVRPLAVAALSDLAEAVGIVGACPDSKAMNHGGPNAGKGPQRVRRRRGGLAVRRVEVGSAPRSARSTLCTLTITLSL